MSNRLGFRRRTSRLSVFGGGHPGKASAWGKFLYIQWYNVESQVGDRVTNRDLLEKCIMKKLQV